MIRKYLILGSIACDRNRGLRHWRLGLNQIPNARRSSLQCARCGGSRNNACQLQTKIVLAMPGFIARPLLLICILLPWLASDAQTFTGSVVGRILDSQEAAVANAPVTLISLEKEFER